MRRSNTFLAILTFLSTVAFAESSGDWPGYRGPDRSGTVGGSLLGDGGGLEIGWKRALGSGYASVVVSDGRVIAMFADGEDDFVAAFNEESGEEMWRYRISETYAGHDGSHDGPISTPLVAGGRVFGLGGWGHLFSVDAATGEPAWASSLVEDHGAVKPHYGFTSSPIMVDGVLVLEIGAPEGKAIAGFDPRDGKILWTAGDDGVAYQSPVAATIGGKQLVLATGNAKLFGIEARTGEVLWSHEHGGDGRAMSSQSMVPVDAGDGRFLLMNKMDSSTMVQITPDDELGYRVDELWSNNVLKSSYVIPVYHEGHVYGISGRVLTCLDAATGERVWRSREPGDGFLTLIGDQLVVATKPGTLHVVKASPQGYEELAAIELFEEHVWSEAAFASGHLYARSMNELARIDVVESVSDMRASMAWLARTEFGAFLKRVHEAEDKDAVIETYLAEQSAFPITEGPNLVHFVFRGDADDVGIVGDMIGFRREDPMFHLEGTDLFYYSARLESDAAVTYGFIQSYEDEPSADPLNPAKADGLFGGVSWLAMPAWKAPGYLSEAPTGRQGRLERVEWEREVTESEEGEEKKKIITRALQVYLPAGFDADSDRRYPTLYHFAGMGALEDGSMKNALDNLVGESVEPLIVVFVMPPEGAEGDQIGPRGPFVEMITREVVPLIDERFPTIAAASSRGCVGTGSAGAAALVAALDNTDVFGRVGSQGAVLFSTPLELMLTSADERPMTIYMDWGTYDLRSPHEAWDMVVENRNAWNVLRGAGYRPSGGEVPEGPTWRTWRSHTAELLTALFPLAPEAGAVRRAAGP